MAKIISEPVAGNIDHNNLADLTVGDDHTQYALLAGRATPQQLAFGNATGASTGYLTSTSHATKGKYFLNSSGTITIDELNTRVGIGITSPLTRLHIVNSTDCIQYLEAYAGGAASYSGRAARGSFATPLIVTDQDVPFELYGYAYDGATFQPLARIRFQVEGTPGAGDMPGSLVFATTPDGSAVLVNRLTIHQTGILSLETANAYIDLSAITAGNPNLKITATSDVPTVAFTGGGNAPTTAPAGYLEILVGATPRYIPFWA